MQVEKLYREYFARLMGWLLKHTGCNPAEAEDCVQDAFVAALEQWPVNPPPNPAGWLYITCRNIASKKNRSAWPLLHVPSEIFEDRAETAGEHYWPGIEEENRARLLTLFTFLVPSFSPKQQLILTLRYVTGFSVATIAATLGMPAETITKIIQRCRARMKENHSILNSPGPAPEFISIAYITLYLLFNEGYKMPEPGSAIHEEFCAEALELTKIMLTIPAYCSPELEALYALMLFHTARFPARFDDEGGITDLETQDRTQWNKEMIAVAEYHLNKAISSIKAASATNEVSIYHLQASIAWLHCRSASFLLTPWDQVTRLHERIYAIQPSPFIRLNLAIAHHFGSDHDRVEEILNELGDQSFMQAHYPFHIAKARHLEVTAGKSAAEKSWLKAISLCRNQREITYIRKCMNSCDQD